MYDILNMHSLIYQNPDSTSGNVVLKPPTIRDNCECSQAIENGQMIMLNTPLIIYSAPNPNNRSLVLGSCTEVFGQNICESDYLHLPNGQDLTKNVIDLRNKHENLSVIKLCDNIVDAPEYIDKRQLSEITNNTKDSSDEDDVVFVKEYKASGGDQDVKNTEKGIENGNIRRNPVRNVRNKCKNLPKEILFEEDFAFLDTSDDDLEEKIIKIEKKPQIVNLPKEWPINVHERPEYNAATNKIESFDYTIREIQKNAAAIKKPKPEAVNVRNKPKKKPAVRRKKKPVPVPLPPPETVSLDELKPLINSTTDMLKNYFVNSKKHKDLISSNSALCTFENKVEVLRNQAFLFAIVNNLDERQVVDKFKHLNVDNETKS